jgi:two-component system nitrate/nitrite response regulator NarL
LRQIRVFLADDHGLVLQAVRLALEPHPEIEIVGEVRSGSEVLPRVAETRPDIVLLDIRMPGLDGLQVLDRLQKLYPKTKVVMLSGVDDPELATEALRRGAKAFLGKGIDPAEMAPVLHQVFDGTVVTESFGAPSVAERAADEFGLTGREREILEQVASGQSNKQIAGTFWLSEQTIKYHLTNVYRKLGVSSRTEAARFAYDHGLAGSTWPGEDRNQHESPGIG